MNHTPYPMLSWVSAPFILDGQLTYTPAEIIGVSSHHGEPQYVVLRPARLGDPSCPTHNPRCIRSAHSIPHSALTPCPAPAGLQRNPKLIEKEKPDSPPTIPSTFPLQAEPTTGIFPRLLRRLTMRAVSASQLTLPKGAA